MGRLSIVGLSGGRQLGVGLSRSRRLGLGLSWSRLLGLGLRGAACPDVLKGPGTRVSLPVAHYSDIHHPLLQLKPSSKEPSLHHHQKIKPESRLALCIFYELFGNLLPKG